MSKFIGRLIKVGIGKESSRGTKVAPTYWLDLISAPFEDKFNHVTDDDSVGVIEDAKALKVSKKFASGDLNGKVSDKSFGLFLLSTFGAVNSAVKETTAYNHTFTVSQSAQHQSLTVEKKDPNEQIAFANAVITDLELKAQLGKYVEFKAGLLAKTGTSASNTPSYTAENSFIAKDVAVKFATDLASLDAASAVNVKNVTLKIDKNVESDDVLGSNEPADFLNKQIGISGSIELIYDDATYKALALAGTSKAMRIDIKNTDVTIGAISNPELKIDLAKVHFTEWARAGAANEVVKQTLNFKAFYSMTDSKMITVVLTNTATSY